MNEIYKSGLSGDRVMELLRRQYAVPTLPAAPTDSTFSWVDDMGYANTFRVGELCRVKDDDDYIFYILEELKDGEATWIPLSGGGSGEQPEMEAIDRLLKQKLDNLFFSRLFVAIDANGIEISPNDTTTPIASIRANYGLWTEYFLSAKGRNPSTGSSSGGDGASTLGGLNNVADGADVGEEGYDAAKMLVLEAKSNLWTLRNLSELVGLDEDALLAYLTTNNYAKKSDIPSLTGYATESWVLGKGYATTSDLDARIDALVNGAPAAYDTLKEIADVLGRNVDSIADILDALGTKANKVDVDAAISAVNASISALNTELSGKIDLKLDAATFNELFEKVLLEDGKTYAIRAKLGLFSDSFLSAKGANSSGGSSSGGAGALYQLADVLADGQQVSGAATGALLMYNGTQWQGVSQSEIVPNLTGYAKLTDIPTDDINKGVTAYGWGDHSKVGYLTSITSALVTGALGFTPFDSANFTKAKIKSTLGISDWALASSKPSYTTSEVTEGANLYFTNARAVAALKSITDGLGSDISTLQGYFTNGVAKSAARLSTNTVYKAWGQTFFENGVPKAVSGALTDVTDITSSGTITTNKIVIGDGAIEWDETNKGFKIVGGLYTETYLSSKGANPNGGSSSGGGQYTRLDEWTNYSSAYDTWVLSAKLGKGLYDTQNSLLTRVGALEGKATNVSFTQSLTSGTQIGSISIDGVTKNIYAPTIPTKLSQFTDDVVSGKYLPLSGGAITGLLTINGSSTDNNRATIHLVSNGDYPNDLYFGSNSTLHWSLSSRDSNNKYYFGLYNAITSNWVFIANSETNIIDYQYLPTYTGNKFIHEGNYTDYVYSKTTIDSKLGGYLPLSGGTITGSYSSLTISSGADNKIILNETGSDTKYQYIEFQNNSVRYGMLGTFGTDDLKWNTNILIHSGNIGSQSVDNADKLDGYHAKASNTPFDGIPVVRGDGVMEIGKYIDFHNDNTSNNDFDCRLDIQGNYNNIVHLPTSSGILALLTSNVASATKLATSRKLWGQSFNGENDVNGHLSIGTILGQVAANRAELSIVSETDVPCDLWLGNSAGNVWSINCRPSNENRSFSIFHGSLGHLFRIDGASGNVGIGTTNPQYKLDVIGGGLFTDSTNTYGVIIGNNNVIDGYTKGTNSANLYINRYTTGNVYIAMGGGYVGVGTNSPQYNLDVNGTLHANNTVTFDNALKVGGVTSIGAAQGQYDSYRAQLSVISTTNQPAMFWLGSSGEKKWSLESRGEANSYRFSLYSWVSSKHILWIEHSGVATLDGTFNATTGIWSNGYVSAKGQNTSSDMRLKNVLNEVVLGVKDIANAPSMRFAWKNGGGVDVGSSAQYWQGLLPDAVKERDGMLEMQYANIALLSAIAIAKRVETHEERIERLEREVKELRIENERLKIGGRYAE